MISVGLDLVAVEAVRESLAASHAERYLSRVYTEAEVRDCQTADGVDPERLAARFAAKEATLKVLSAGDEGVPMDTIEVRREPTGRAYLALHGHAAELASRAGISDFSLSLTHEGGFAAAVVVAEAPEGSPPDRRTP
jgi:holo-[acyl-carrier protein] synthase